ncbi:Mu transposase C-terminal domain-containing protein [Arthrobacter sp. YAF34]|uniref:Mu transposase C-terminal domain-containing protein n=1 Tax=Arthrobacter sp. YAF34 TaxID=3233083 RepID=UPI003F93F28E
MWQNLETDALRNPEYPGRRYSPNTMYEALTYRTGCLFTPITRNTFITMLPVEERTIGRVGIQLRKRRYDTAELDPYRGKPSGNQLAKDLWRVHYKPDNPAAVWVYITELDCFPDAGKYIECHWVNADAFDSPFSRATRENEENIAALGQQITAKERSDLSRQLVRGAAAAAEKEFRAAADREQREKLADEQGIGRPKPTTIVEPEDSSKMWAGATGTDAYKLFDPDDIVNAMDTKHYLSEDATADAPENLKRDEKGL